VKEGEKMAQPIGSAPRVLLALVSAGLLVLAVTGSVGVSATTRAAADGSLACKNGTLTVGIAKAKSGLASFFDIAGTRGTKIAIDQINAAGGIKGCKIKTIEGDTKSDPAVAAQVARSLLDKGAQILLVPDDFDLGIAAARVGQKAGVLTLSLAASSTEFAKAVGDKFFNAGPTTTQLANAQSAFALQRGWKRGYMVLDPGLAYFTEQDTVFRQKFQAGGGKMAGTDKVDSLSGKSDYSSTVSKIKSLNPAPTVINAQMIFPPIGSFVKQLRAAGVNTPVIGNVTLQTRELPKLVGKRGSHDVYFSAQVYFEGANQDPKSDPAINKFAKAYQKRFGLFPEQSNGPGAFQAFWAISKALQQRSVTDAASAARAIRAQKNVKVPGGVLVRWESGHAIWNITIDGLNKQGEFRQFAVIKAK
jgi:branched-chain amino acid transport system substrate-binding protein